MSSQFFYFLCFCVCVKKRKKKRKVSFLSLKEIENLKSKKKLKEIIFHFPVFFYEITIKICKTGRRVFFEKFKIEKEIKSYGMPMYFSVQHKFFFVLRRSKCT